ncbi:metFprotein [Roseospira marina]|uniref:MetFprotein n=1 Tax=Roseospira marina TaxID=140057 RepID=A0A5M6IHJ7_9PROT|nr:methylenetetrahydrofolate reductase [Roseospira marina]KAA5607259.1 metFprotein [Roseospira marina]MBB4312589.1 methylenetetrahydrofolate reductase (NADPH) [Roseospira marina]MBB5085395.1 methylenetetrahydrofolate reductase (NADPH) [Roseospira marina]
MPYDSLGLRTSTDAASARAGACLPSFSLEVTPGAARKVPSFAALLPAGTAVYITSLPGTDPAEVMALCRRLRGEGLRPVPHLAARSLRNRADLSDWLGRAVHEVGVRDILLLAGSADRPAGPFQDTRSVLESGLLDAAGLSGFGVAGHPEGHPQANRGALWDALRMKQAFAEAHGLNAWIVTQFTFSAKPVLAWLRTLPQEGIALPVRVGLPGPAKPATLITYARQCGVGASLRVLTRRPDVLAGLVKAWAPDAIVDDLSKGHTRDAVWSVAGVHLFPFGGFAKTAAWGTTRWATGTGHTVPSPPASDAAQSPAI